MSSDRYVSSERYVGTRAPLAGDEFRRACGRFATGVTVATVLDAKGAPHGLTASSFTSVSLHPPLVLLCLAETATAISHFRAASYFGINVLAAGQQALSERFARKGHDRFQGVEWQAGATGVPLLPGVLAALECGVHRIVPMGDHDILVGEVVRVQVNEGDPLVYFASGYREL